MVKNISKIICFGIEVEKQQKLKTEVKKGWETGFFLTALLV